MILGWYSFRKAGIPRLEDVKKSFGLSDLRPEQALLGDQYALIYLPENVPGIDQESGVFHSDVGKHQGVFQGHLINVSPTKGSPSPSIGKIEEIMKDGDFQAFGQVKGSFVGAVCQPEKQEFFLFRDHLGIESLYYFEKEGKIFFSTSLRKLASLSAYKKQLNYQVLYRYLLFNYNPGTDTFFEGIYKLQPGRVFLFRQGQKEFIPFWRISYGKVDSRPIKAFKKELLEKLNGVVSERLPQDETETGVFLSGGMDSSSVVGISSSYVKKPLHTFSFRCKGKGFDESYYAEFMARYYKTQHHLVEYPPEKIVEIEELVSYMEEPFSDIGIEIASFLLAKEARNQVEIILTGDGGDELFAGHPVYLADKMSQKYDFLPLPIKRGIYKLSRMFPDTDEKKSFSVKVKRFSYSAQFPKSLYSNRWRMYYTAEEIKELVQPDLWRHLQETRPLDYFYRLYDQADGQDYLSKSLYADYYTVVDFYLRRMAILRNFGIESRFPLLDPEIVTYSTRIPAEYKINKSMETKYIQHVTLDGVLPDEIVHRKDKLGHSVPMKNWMRENDFVRDYVFSHLNESEIGARGFFNPAVIEKLKQEHLRRKENHSHRLWSMMILEMWLKRNFD